MATPMNNHIENRLWAAADQLWANSPLKPSEYSNPLLGLIFLKYADYKFGKVASDIAAEYKTSGRRSPSKIDFQSRIGLFIPTRPGSLTSSPFLKERISERQLTTR
jgi:type I restriction enzyme M protein